MTRDHIYRALAKHVGSAPAREVVSDVTGWGQPLEGSSRVSQATREKLRAAAKGKPRPLEVRQKIAKSLAGRAPSAMTRAMALEAKQQKKTREANTTSSRT